jgi:hypothetical protein
MIQLKLIVFPFLFASASSLANSAPIVKSETNSLEIKTNNNDVEVQLPETAFQVLKKWNPEFVIFGKKDYGPSILEMFKEMGENHLPMAFIEDVDGNDKKDIVLLGADLNNQYAVALLQRDKKWTLVKIAQWSLKNIKDTVIPATTVASATATAAAASGTSVAKETGVPLYVLPALGEQAEKLKAKKKVGIQVELYLGPGDVYEIKGTKAVKFTL